MKSTTGRFILFILAPTLVGMLSVGGLLLASGINSPVLAATDASISVGSLAFIAWVLANLLRFYRPSQGKEWILAAWIILFASIWLVVSTWILKILCKNSPDYIQLVNITFWLRYFIALLAFTCVALITWVRRQNESEGKARERFNETQRLAREAELNSIRQQLQPHFLFNSLNSIYALIGTEPAKARVMVQQLSDFLRGTLRRDSTQMITVGEEILHTRLYLEIEKVRFPRLQVVWTVGEECEKLKTPVLLLQPVVENAIKFGLYDTRENVEIKISVNCENDMLTFMVENPFDPKTASNSNGTGFGLDSIRRRLYLLFGRNDLLETSATDNHFFATMKIPQFQ